jgi:hypothetical protein
MSSDPVSRTSAENARLRAGLAAERRAAAGSARPRDGATLASDADRDCAAEALKSAYAEGALDRYQFEARLTAPARVVLAVAGIGGGRVHRRAHS